MRLGGGPNLDVQLFHCYNETVPGILTLPARGTLRFPGDPSPLVVGNPGTKLSPFLTLGLTPPIVKSMLVAPPVAGLGWAAIEGTHLATTSVGLRPTPTIGSGSHVSCPSRRQPNYRISP